MKTNIFNEEIISQIKDIIGSVGYGGSIYLGKPDNIEEETFDMSSVLSTLSKIFQCPEEKIALLSPGYVESWEKKHFDNEENKAEITEENIDKLNKILQDQYDKSHEYDMPDKRTESTTHVVETQPGLTDTSEEFTSSNGNRTSETSEESTTLEQENSWRTSLSNFAVNCWAQLFSSEENSSVKDPSSPVLPTKIEQKVS